MTIWRVALNWYTRVESMCGSQKELHRQIGIAWTFRNILMRDLDWEQV
jgi:hypothetical protein